MRSHEKHDDTFKVRAIRAAIKSGNVTKSARRLGVRSSTLGKWVKTYRSGAIGKEKLNYYEYNDMIPNDIRFSYIALRYIILILLFVILSILLWLGLFTIKEHSTQRLSIDGTNLKTFEASFQSLDGSIWIPFGKDLHVRSHKNVIIQVSPGSDTRLLINDGKERKNISLDESSIAKSIIHAPSGTQFSLLDTSNTSPLFSETRRESREIAVAWQVSTEGLLTWDTIPEALGYNVYEDYTVDASKIAYVISNTQYQLDTYHEGANYIIVPLIEPFSIGSDYFVNISLETGKLVYDNAMYAISDWTFTSDDNVVFLSVGIGASSSSLKINRYSESTTMKVEIIYKDGTKEVLDVVDSSLAVIGSQVIRIESAEIVITPYSYDKGDFSISSISNLKSTGTENVSLYETAKPIETTNTNKELIITDNANSFNAYMDLGEDDLVTYSVTGELSYQADASINGFSLKSSLAQWFLGDPMVLGINILVLLSLPFVAMPILERWLFWRELSMDTLNDLSAKMALSAQWLFWRELSIVKRLKYRDKHS